MPRTTVYIRKEDWDKWQATENKSELISQALGRSVVAPIVDKSTPPKQTDNVAAEHDCCSKPAPCKHWSWDGDTQMWKNQLSGRTKEA